MKICIILISLFHLIQSSPSVKRIDYSGYHVLQNMDNVPLMDVLGWLEDEKRLITPLTSDQSVILVHPSYVHEVISKLNYLNVNYKVVLEDLQQAIDEERKNMKATAGNETSGWFESYHTFDELLFWLENLTIKYSKYCSLFDIGKSFHGKPLRVLKIVGTPNECKQKPSIWIDSGIHAREWITGTTSTYIIDRLLNEYGSDLLVKKLRDTYDWYFLVIVNPDGYEYSWEKDRMWRKSRSPTSNQLCIGVDINRNFDFQWMTVGASNIPCAESYAGPKGNSEPETKAVASFIFDKRTIWDMFLTLHSYGELWMSPWGYTKELPNDYSSLEKVGQAGVEAIYKVHGTKYTFGTAANILYQSSGTSRDWAKGVPQIPYVYTIELRNKSSFVLHPSEILPTGEEIWAGLRASFNKLQNEHPPKCKD